MSASRRVYEVREQEITVMIAVGKRERYEVYQERGNIEDVLSQTEKTNLSHI